MQTSVRVGDGIGHRVRRVFRGNDHVELLLFHVVLREFSRVKRDACAGKTLLRQIIAEVVLAVNDIPQLILDPARHIGKDPVVVDIVRARAEAIGAHIAGADRQADLIIRKDGAIRLVLHNVIALSVCLTGQYHGVPADVFAAGLPVRIRDVQFYPIAREVRSILCEEATDSSGKNIVSQLDAALKSFTGTIKKELIVDASAQMIGDAVVFAALQCDAGVLDAAFFEGVCGGRPLEQRMTMGRLAAVVVDVAVVHNHTPFAFQAECRTGATGADRAVFKSDIVAFAGIQADKPCGVFATLCILFVIHLNKVAVRDGDIPQMTGPTPDSQNFVAACFIDVTVFDPDILSDESGLTLADPDAACTGAGQLL